MAEFVLVPREPTEAMLNEAYRKMRFDPSCAPFSKRILLKGWDAMLAAAPQPPEDAVERVALLDRLLDWRNQLPSGVWEVWTSNSFRRITAKGGPDGGVLYGYAQRSDGHGDLSMSEGQLNALVSIVNAVPDIAAALSPSPREKALEEALRNMMGLFDNPIYRRKLADEDGLYAESIRIARALLDKEGK